MKPQDINSHELTCPHCQKRLAYVPPIGFALTHGPADAQALADVRTLDEWGHWRQRPVGGSLIPERAIMVELYPVTSNDHRHYGPTPDAARHAAAEWAAKEPGK